MIVLHLYAKSQVANKINLHRFSKLRQYYLVESTVVSHMTQVCARMSIDYNRRDRGEFKCIWLQGFGLPSNFCLIFSDSSLRGSRMSPKLNLHFETNHGSSNS